ASATCCWIQPVMSLLMMLKNGGRPALRWDLVRPLEDPSVHDAQERVDQGGAELFGTLAIQLSNGLRHGPGGLVGTLLSQRVEHVRDGHDASGQRNRIAGDPRVAFAVPAFVMIQGDLLGEPKDRKLAAREDPCPDGRVRLDQAELRLR